MQVLCRGYPWETLVLCGWYASYLILFCLPLIVIFFIGVNHSQLNYILKSMAACRLLSATIEMCRDAFLMGSQFLSSGTNFAIRTSFCNLCIIRGLIVECDMAEAFAR